ncbi:MAG: HAE1 family hydrophobic/amphiphilic exporter-1, partial [Enterobacterales bacterium]
QEMRDLRITPADQPSVLLGDVSTITWGSKDREEITRFGAEEGVLISMYKEGDANTVDVANAIKSQLLKLNKNLPEGNKILVQFDQSRFIEQSIDEVKKSLMIGGLLAIAVLWFFLRDFRLTAIITTAIPLSVVATFIFMYRSDVSLNIMSLGGLTLGVGMLVDSAIVVLESIHRQREKGLTVFEAAVKGSTDVGGAVTASVFTTIAVFIPIVFVEGVAGQLFRDQALTVTFSLLASLVLSFTLVPMLASIGSRKKAKSASEIVKPVKITGGSKRLVRFYRSVLNVALTHPKKMVLSGFMTLGFCLLLVPQISTALIPQLSEGEFYFDVTLAEGTALPATTKVLKTMETIALEQPDIARVYVSIGSRNVSGGLSLKNKDENLGQINIVIKERNNTKMEQRIITSLREQYSQLPGADIQFGRPSFFSLKTPMEMLFFGEDIKALRDYTVELLPKVKLMKGLKDIRASLETGNPELMVTFDRNKLSQLGFSIDQVSETIKQRVSGVVVSKFQRPDRQINIRLRNRLVDRTNVNDMHNIVIGEVNGQAITLAAVAEITSAQGPAAIDRIQQSRVAIIAANLDNSSLKEVSAKLAELVRKNPPPAGVVFEFGGQNKEMETSFNSLFFAIGLAVFLVYLVMASTFEHLGHPFVILLTIPLSLIGVIVGLYFSGYAISVISMIGTVFLVGIVVNNAIVLIDAINQARFKGLEKREAIIFAGESRLRPILMTTCTTVLGLLPMAIGFGEGAELRAPLAVVVSSGLIVSTILTLLIIPAVYLLMPSKVETETEQQEREHQLEVAEEVESHHQPEAMD